MELFVTNFCFAVSISILLSLGLLVYIRRPKGGKVNVLFFIFSLLAAIWQIFYVLGINVSDPMLSRWFFSLATFEALFILIINIQQVTVLVGRYQSLKKIIWGLYGISVLVIFIYLPDINKLLLPSKPALYMNNFFVPGPWYGIQDTLFFIVFIFLFYQFFISYIRADRRMKNRLKYFIVAYVIGYTFSLFPELLVYGYKVDPFPASILGLYGLPMAYAILKYEAIDLNILAKRALGYALSITGVTMTILLIGYANDVIVATVPSFPQWFLPLCSAAMAVAVGVFVWERVKETENLKYQFVDVVTHKFRTPLTYIRWSLDILRAKPGEKESAHALSAIESANARLIELTNTLTGLSSTDNNEYKYMFHEENIGDLVKETIDTMDERIRERQPKLEIDLPADLPKVIADRKKIIFSLQIVIENAILYSPGQAHVHIGAERKGDFLIVSVRDNGMGVAKEDLSHIFTKFYRGKSAQHAHTEGLGIGLYLSREILRRHGGDMTVDSEGKDKGSTFFLKIPIKKV